jgi:Protein of unknown function (DUF1565)
MRCLLLAFAAILAPLAHAATYYVSTSGSNTNTGTETLPWRTIQHACSSAHSGDTVLVETGVYNEAVTLKVPMILEAAFGAKPVIDGTGLVVPETNNALVLIENLSNVRVSGFEIRNYITTDSNAVPSGVFIDGAGSNITVSGNTIHAIENNGTVAANINAFGIAVYGDSANGPITTLNLSGNTVYGTKTGNSETVTLNGNVTNFLVKSNYIHDVDNIGIDCIGYEGTSPIAADDRARNGVVMYNTVVNVTSLHNPSYAGNQSADGIYLDGGEAITIQDNIVNHTDIGIEVASEHANKFATDVLVRNNLVYLNNVVGFSIGGYAQTVGGTEDCSFINNSLIENDTTNSGSGEMQIQYHTSGNVFANNMLEASDQGIFFSGVTGTGSAVGMTSNYNLFYAFANPTWGWDGSNYTSLAAFTKGTANDKNSLYARPIFISGTCRLAYNSPGIGAGSLAYVQPGETDITGGAREVSGKVDVGCYEYASDR